jgi:hypothetical protein
MVIGWRRRAQFMGTFQRLGWRRPAMGPTLAVAFLRRRCRLAPNMTAPRQAAVGRVRASGERKLTTWACRTIERPTFDISGSNLVAKPAKWACELARGTAEFIYYHYRIGTRRKRRRWWAGRPSGPLARLGRAGPIHARSRPPASSRAGPFVGYGRRPCSLARSHHAPPLEGRPRWRFASCHFRRAPSRAFVLGGPRVCARVCAEL